MRISAKQWSVLSPLFDEAMELPQESRESWLESVGPLDAGLKRELRALLERHARIETSDFLQTLPKFRPAESDATDAVKSAALLAGTIVGPYVIEQEIGRGGMGVVWRARRADGLVKRPVALKLLRAGFYSSELLARFARERDILGALEHPHIARLYDAGVADNGQPFLALQYVEGTPISEYCEASRLSIRERLSLFRQVLAAVQYAHSHLVIHRDLKPSNILVTSAGQVQLLDFGIAKLLASEGASAPTLTEFGSRVLTLDYAAPEQISGAPITTATDVYSLGVILYELLAGQRPYRLTRDSRGALEDAILSAEPRRPSAVALDENQMTRNGAGASGRQRSRMLLGDLDTIVLKALKKTPSDRYRTVDAFAADIDNHLGGRPVLARPDTVWYRTRKFLERNALLAASLGAVFVALATGLAVALAQASRAEHEAQIALQERNRARASQEFLLDIFRANSAHQADPERARQLTARQLLDIGSAGIEAKLAQVPEAQEEVYATVAEMYFSLGQWPRAAELQRKRYEVARRLHGSSSLEAARALLGESDAQLAIQLGESEPLNQAMRILRELHEESSVEYGHGLYKLSAIATPRSVGESIVLGEQAIAVLRANGSKDVRVREELGNALISIGWALYAAGQFGKAQSYLNDAIEVLTQTFGPADYETGDAMTQLAAVQFGAGRLADADKSFREGYRVLATTAASDDRTLLFAEAAWGNFLQRTGRIAEGRAHLEHAIAGYRRTGASTLEPLTALGSASIIQGSVEEGVRTLNEVVEIYGRGAGSYMAPTELIAFCDVALGRYPDAGRILDQGWATLISQGMQNNRRGFNVLLFKAILLDATGRGPDALNVIGQAAALNIDRSLAPELNWRLALRRAEAYQQIGDWPAALEQSGEVLKELATDPDRQFFPVVNSEALLLQGKALRRSGQSRAALPILTQAVSAYQQIHIATSPWLADARVALAECLLDVGRTADARRLEVEAKSAQLAHKELGEHFRRPLRELDARLARRST